MSLSMFHKRYTAYFAPSPPLSNPGARMLLHDFMKLGKGNGYIQGKAGLCRVLEVEEARLLYGHAWVSFFDGERFETVLCEVNEEVITVPSAGVVRRPRVAPAPPATPTIVRKPRV